MEAKDLCLDYKQLYDLATKRVVHNDRVVVDLSTEGITRTFDLEIQETMVDIDIDQYNEDFNNNERNCRSRIFYS